MKIAISSSGNSLDSPFDPRFGRCSYFLVVDPEVMSCEVFINQGTAQGRGAGIQAAQFLAAKNVDVVISGHVRPNVLQTFAAAGVDSFMAEQGTIKEIVAQYRSGGLKPTPPFAAGGHLGIGGGARCGGRSRTGKASGGGQGMGHCGGAAG